MITCLSGLYVMYEQLVRDGMSVAVVTPLMTENMFLLLFFFLIQTTVQKKKKKSDHFCNRFLLRTKTAHL